MTGDAAIREELIKLLRGGNAHIHFDGVVRSFPVQRAGERPGGSPHSAWELLEHMRIAQNDILRFSQSPEWVSPPWPEGYWPKSPAPPDEKAWNASVRAFRRDLNEFEALVADPARDLTTPFPWGEGQTLFREALLVADHNSYHLGQLMLVRRQLEPEV